MTREDAVLDAEIFLNNPIHTLYRITRDKYADLSGIGAARVPGRWNLLGQEAIYTSLNSSTTQLEVLGHTPKDRVPSNLVRMHITFSGRWERFSERVLFSQDTHAWFLVYQTLAAAKEALTGVLEEVNNPSYASSLLGVATPSVHDEQWNVILYPQCSVFAKHVALLRVEPFLFDSRLFAGALPS